jgi:tetratricopeptide (TPR) repeat protein
MEETDFRALEAAAAWIHLGGDYREAAKELERLSPEGRLHQTALHIGWIVYSHLKDWERVASIGQLQSKDEPNNYLGWIHHAQGLHELGRTEEAKEVLLPVVDKFPDNFWIPMELARYACRLGEPKEGLEWLRKAIAREERVRKMALGDTDFKPLWKEIKKAH